MTTTLRTLARAMQIFAAGAVGCSSAPATDALSGRALDAAMTTQKDAGRSDGAHLDAGSPKRVEAGVLADAGVPSPDAHSTTAAVADASDASQCLLTGALCGASTVCCTDRCVNGACGGCVPEGQTTVAGTPCCDGLSAIDNVCGTSACVADGLVCGVGDGGKPCCNDNCNNGRCGP